MRSRGRCSGSGRRAGLRRWKLRTSIFAAAAAIRRRLGLRRIFLEISE
jgi:hypothetical protein